MGSLMMDVYLHVTCISVGAGLPCSDSPFMGAKGSFYGHGNAG